MLAPKQLGSMNNAMLFFRVLYVLIFKFTAVPQGRVYIEFFFFFIIDDCSKASH